MTHYPLIQIIFLFQQLSNQQQNKRKVKEEVWEESIGIWDIWVLEIEEEHDIFGSKYKDIDFRISELDDIDSIDEKEEKNIKKENKTFLFENESYEEESEESIFDKFNDEDEDLDDIEKIVKPKKKKENKLLSSLKKLATKSSSKVTNE